MWTRDLSLAALAFAALCGAVLPGSAAAAPQDDAADVEEPPPPLDAMAKDDVDRAPDRDGDDVGRDRRRAVDDDEDLDDWRQKRRARRMERRRAQHDDATPVPDEVIGGDDLLLAAGQTATGAAVCAVSVGIPLLCAFVPFGSIFAGPGLWAMMCFGMPALSTLAQVSLGDALGTRRGVLGWPMAAQIAYQVAITLVAGALGAVGLILFLGALVVIDGGMLSPVTLSGVGLYGMAALGGGVGILHMAATIAGNAIPAAVYLLTAEPKFDDDPEFRFPGFLEPAHASRDDRPSTSPGFELPEAPRAAMSF